MFPPNFLLVSSRTFEELRASVRVLQSEVYEEGNTHGWRVRGSQHFEVTNSDIKQMNISKATKTKKRCQTIKSHSTVNFFCSCKSKLTFGAACVHPAGDALHVSWWSLAQAHEWVSVRRRMDEPLLTGDSEHITDLGNRRQAASPLGPTVRQRMRSCCSTDSKITDSIGNTSGLVAEAEVRTWLRTTVGGRVGINANWRTFDK